MPCIVRGCTSGYPRNPEKVHYFTVPADPRIRRLWQEAIKNYSVKAGRAVCEKHFQQDEIRWQRYFMSPLGEVVGVGQYKVPRLRKGTVPSMFPWTKKVTLEIESSRKEQNEQSQLNEGKRTSVLPGQEQQARSSSNEEKMFGRQSLMLIDEACTISVEGKQANEIIPKVEKDTLTFEELLTTKLRLPPGWFEDSSGCDGKRLITFFNTQYVRVEETCDIRVMKNVMVTEDMIIELKVSGCLYRANEVTVPRDATSIEELQDLLLRIHRLNVCSGVPNSTTLGLEQEFKILKKDANDTWRHTECLLLVTNEVCVNCHKAKDAISKFKRRQVQREEGNQKEECSSLMEEKRKGSLLHTRTRSALRATRLATTKNWKYYVIQPNTIIQQ